jgi:predicted porin
MKRASKPLSLTIACGMVALASSPEVHAQPVLFGVVDQAVRHVDNDRVGSIKSVVSGANQTSRIGFRGTETLGSGLSAGFHLESGVIADTGGAGAASPAGQFWDRRATVSLISAPAGELRIGRDFTQTYLAWGRYDPFGYVGVASSSNLLSNAPTGPIRSAFSTGPNVLLRSSNAVQWFSPNWAGVQIGLIAAPGEGGTAANGQHRHVGGRIAYNQGPVSVSLATGSTRNDITGNNNFRDTVGGASYDFRVVKLMGVARRFSYLTADQTNVLLAVTAPVGAGEIRASLQRATYDGTVGAINIGANESTQIGLGYVHNLSKRTALYATASRLSNDGANAITIPGGPTGMAAGGTSTGFEFGLRHGF